jgi:hypothetical protein
MQSVCFQIHFFPFSKNKFHTKNISVQQRHFPNPCENCVLHGDEDSRPGSVGYVVFRTTFLQGVTTQNNRTEISRNRFGFEVIFFVSLHCFNFSIIIFSESRKYLTGLFFLFRILSPCLHNGRTTFVFHSNDILPGWFVVLKNFSNLWWNISPKCLYNSEFHFHSALFY